MNDHTSFKPCLTSGPNMTTNMATAVETAEDSAAATTGSIPTTAEMSPTRYGFRRTVVANWRELIAGDTVVLIARNKDRIEGTTDAVTKNGAFLWLPQDALRARQVFYHSDGYIVLVDPRAD
ncbi:hypothetical protein ACTAQI_04765 [Pseudarthrobacter sp. alpha12b]